MSRAESGAGTSYALESGGVAPDRGRVHQGARAEESDPARWMVQLAIVARRPEKKPAQPATRRVLPMEHSDRRPPRRRDRGVGGRRPAVHTSNAGKNARVRVQRVEQPDVTAIRTWRAHERMSVKRATAEEGKR